MKRITKFLYLSAALTLTLGTPSQVIAAEKTDKEQAHKSPLKKKVTEYGVMAASSSSQPASSSMGEKEQQEQKSQALPPAELSLNDVTRLFDRDVYGEDGKVSIDDMPGVRASHKEPPLGAERVRALLADYKFLPYCAAILKDILIAESQGTFGAGFEHEVGKYELWRMDPGAPNGRRLITGSNFKVSFSRNKEESISQPSSSSGVSSEKKKSKKKAVPPSPSLVPQATSSTMPVDSKQPTLDSKAEGKKKENVGRGQTTKPITINVELPATSSSAPVDSKHQALDSKAEGKKKAKAGESSKESKNKKDILPPAEPEATETKKAAIKRVEKLEPPATLTDDQLIEILSAPMVDAYTAKWYKLGQKAEYVEINGMQVAHKSIRAAEVLKIIKAEKELERKVFGSRYIDPNEDEERGDENTFGPNAISSFATYEIWLQSRPIVDPDTKKKIRIKMAFAKPKQVD